jgi:hypothetical protein
MTWNVIIEGNGNKLTSYTMTGKLSSETLDLLLMMQEDAFRHLSKKQQLNFNFSARSVEEPLKSAETGPKSTDKIYYSLDEKVGY